MRNAAHLIRVRFRFGIRVRVRVSVRVSGAITIEARPTIWDVAHN